MYSLLPFPYYVRGCFHPNLCFWLPHLRFPSTSEGPRNGVWLLVIDKIAGAMHWFKWSRSLLTGLCSWMLCFGPQWEWDWFGSILVDEKAIKRIQGGGCRWWVGFNAWFCFLVWCRIKWVCRIFIFFIYFLLVADSITLPMSSFFNTHSSIFMQKLFAQVVKK